MALTDNLVSYWKLDEASGTRADSKGTNTLASINAVGQAAGKLGNAAAFDGTSSQALQITDAASAQTLRVAAGGITIACWVYPTASANQGVAVRENTGIREYRMVLTVLNQAEWMVANSAGTGYSAVSGSGTVPPNTWTLLIGWYDPAAGQVGLQVNNGTPATASFAGTPRVTTNIFDVGGGGGGFENYYAGRIDALGKWDRALTPTERLSLYNNGSGAEYPWASVTLVTVPVTDPNLFFSPYNWDSDGAGALAANNIKGSSTYARSNTPGAYLKAKFTGTSVSLGVDVSVLAGSTLAAYDWPRLAYSVDGAAWVYHQIVSTDTSIILANGLAAGTHTLDVYFASIYALVNNFGDRWTTPVNAVVVTGLTLDALAASAAPTLQSRRAVIYGDSITEGARNLLGTGADSVATQDAGLSWAPWLAAALGAEYGIVAFSGQGYVASTDASFGGLPSLANAWNLYSAGRSRLSSGLFAPAPDYVVSDHGTNDLSSLTDPVMIAQVAAWRAAAPAAAILICQCFGQVDATQITSGVVAYRAAHPTDARVFILDPGVALNSLQNSWDGLHPSTRGDAIYGAMLADRARAALAGGGASRRGIITGGVL